VGPNFEVIANQTTNLTKSDLSTANPVTLIEKCVQELAIQKRALSSLF
jgi:hypothetical protein